MGKVDFGGVQKEICLACVPTATVGDFVLVHAGFAINRIDESAAKATLSAFEELSSLEESPDQGKIRDAETQSPTENR